jgi:hypothetical protein
MPFKILYGQDKRPYVEADTPTEALEFLKLASNGNGSDGAKQMSLPLDEPQAIAKLFSEIADRPKKILRALLDFPQGTDAGKISEITKEPTTGFGGLLGSVTKQAEKLGLRPESIFVSELKNSGLKRYRSLAPGKLLIKHSEILLKR